MTPEELKDTSSRMATALYNRYKMLAGENAKKCTLIAVDELIKEQDMWQNGQVNPVKFWQAVKKELLKLQ